MGYVLVPTVLSGAHEWTAHLTQLVLVWIAIVAMTSLVLRFGWDRQHAIVGSSAFGGHRSFSSHGQHRNARYPRDRRRAGGNGTSCCVEGRAEMEPGRSCWYRAGTSQALREPTLHFFYRSLHFSA